MHSLIDAAGLQKDVKCISTIYDSIYYLVKADPVTIKWVNDNLITCMTKDFMENQTIPNEATAEIGLDWSLTKQIPNGSSLAAITEVLTFIQALDALKLKFALPQKLIDNFFSKGFGLVANDLVTLLSTSAEEAEATLSAHTKK